MSRHYIFQCQGQQKSFYLSEFLEIGQFCRLLRTVFQMNDQIAALQDINNNIYDLKYFCQNLALIEDRFFVIQLESQRPKPQRSRSRGATRRSKKSNSLEVQSPNYVYDFHNFLNGLQQRYMHVQEIVHWTCVILFDSAWQANLYQQKLIGELQQALPEVQIFFTVYKESDWVDETILVTLFANEHLKVEQEVPLDDNVFDRVYRVIESSCVYEEQQATPRSNSIPIIVTRGDQRQVLQVEPNENFHSSQGKRGQGLMRIKRELEKIRDRLSDSEYQQLLDLIVLQDQNILAAYQLYQRLQNEEQFVQNLKALVPRPSLPIINVQQTQNIVMNDTNISFNKNPTEVASTRSTTNILSSILQSKQLSKEEAGMFKSLQSSQDLLDIVQSLSDQDDEVIMQVVKPYLRDQFLKVIEANFNGSQIEYLLKKSEEKMHPTYAALLNFQQNGDVSELIEIWRENLPEEEPMEQYSFPPRQQSNLHHLIKAQEDQPSYAMLIRGKGKQRQSTFRFKMLVGPNHDNELGSESPVQKRKQSEEEFQLQIIKEQQFLDKFHNKDINYFDADHGRIFQEVIEMNVIEEEDKNKIIDYYQQGNQRLRDILDHFKETKDTHALKQDVADLVSLSNIKRFDEIMSPTNHPLFEPKLQKLKNFRFLINFFYEIDKVFNLKQIKTFFYLYITEDISVLAAYEVYCEDQDQEEFIQTLSLIYKIYSLGNYIELDFDEIEQFDELIEQQLNIMFTYRRFFSIEQRSALEKNLRAGDNTLLKLFKDFIRTKNQDSFIDSTRQFADQRGAALKKIEQILVERRQKRDEIKNENKDLIEKLHPQFMKNKVKHLDMLLEAVDKDSIFLKSAFEVYKYTLDKQDLVENLVLIYNQIYKANVKTMLKSLSIVLQLLKTDLTALLKKIDQDEPILKGAFELYYINRDESELKDTITRMIRLSQY